MEITIFLGYQFKSKFYDKNDLEKAIIESSKDVQARLNKESNHEIFVYYNGVEIDSGENITEEILSSINKCDICIFEISNKNANVFFELGYAYAKEKEIIYLMTDEINISDIPSDFYGKLIDQYNLKDLRIKISDRLYSKSKKAIELEIQERTIFDFQDKKDVYIVVSELPKEERISHSYPENENFAHRLLFGDPDALHELTMFLNRKFPNTKFHEHTTSDLPSHAANNDLVILGGPGLNAFAESVINDFDFPLKYIRKKVEGHFVLYNQFTKTEYSVKRISSANKIDYGFVAKIPNTNNDKTCYYLFNGILTHGVLGSVRLFTLDESRKIINNKLHKMFRNSKQYFLVLTETNIIKHKAFPKMIDSSKCIIYDSYNSKFVCNR